MTMRRSRFRFKQQDGGIAEIDVIAGTTAAWKSSSWSFDPGWCVVQDRGHITAVKLTIADKGENEEA